MLHLPPKKIKKKKKKKKGEREKKKKIVFIGTPTVLQGDGVEGSIPGPAQWVKDPVLLQLRHR